MVFTEMFITLKKNSMEHVLERLFISSIWNMQKDFSVKNFQGNSVIEGNISPADIKPHNIVALLFH